jgi:hypothetical protein
MKKTINEKKINELFNKYQKIAKYYYDYNDKFYDEQFKNLYFIYIKYELKLSEQDFENALLLNIYYKERKDEDFIIEERYFWTAENNIKGVNKMNAILLKQKQ